MPAPQRLASFTLHHLLWPMLAFVTLLALLELTNADLLVADWIYQQSGGAWHLRDAWLTRDVIHEGGRLLTAGMVLVLVLAVAASLAVSALRGWRRSLLYLLVSAVLCGLAINLLKELTRVDCPWDLLRYGGEYPYVGIYSPHPDTFRYGACFPAGHASAGYAWFGFYYLALIRRPQWRPQALGSVLLLGLVFGIGQQLRGAHFLSHDVWTAAICWLICTLAFMAFFGSGASRAINTNPAHVRCAEPKAAKPPLKAIL